MRRLSLYLFAAALSRSLLDLEVMVAFDCRVLSGKEAGRLERVERLAFEPVDRRGLDGRLNRPVIGSITLIFVRHNLVGTQRRTPKKWETESSAILQADANDVDVEMGTKHHWPSMWVVKGQM